jgi:hypothetical protein
MVIGHEDNVLAFARARPSAFVCRRMMQPFCALFCAFAFDHCQD